MIKKSFFQNRIVHIHIAVFLFGFAGLFGKFIDSSPFYIVFGRTFLAAITLYAFLKFSTGPKTGPENKRDLFMFILQGILLAVHWCAFFYSIQLSNVAIGLVTFSTFPLFVTFLEPVCFKEKLKTFDIFTAFAVFIGIVLVVPDLDFSNNITLGAFWGIMAGFTFAILAMINRYNARKADAITIAFYQNLFAALFLVIPIVYYQPKLPLITDLIDFLVLGIFCTALAHTLFIKSLTEIRAQTASVIAGLEPVYGVVLAFFILQEIPQIRTIFGGLIIVGATILAGIYGKHPQEN